MSREKKVTIRLSEEEISEILAQMEKRQEESRKNAPGPDPGKAGRKPKEDTISGFIREQSLRADSSKELRRIRMVLTRIETQMQQHLLYLQMRQGDGSGSFYESLFMECRKELTALKKVLEEMTDGGDGAEAH